MFAVLFSFIGLAIRYLVVRQGISGLFSTQPFYNRSTFHVRDIALATSFAALTFLGFDSVTTLAEDVKNPRKNVLLAAVSICVWTGLFGGLLVYLGHLVLAELCHFRQRRYSVHRRHRSRWGRSSP